MNRAFRQQLVACINRAADEQWTEFDLTLLADRVDAESIPLIALGCDQVESIRKLNLGNSRLGASGAAAILRSVPQLRRLETLVLHGTGLDGAAIKTLCAALGELPALSDLRLSSNSPGLLGLRSLAEVIPQLRKLRRLDLSMSGIDDDEIAALAKGFAHARHLESLDLAGNELADRGMASLAESCECLEALISLDLNWNRIGPFGLGAFAEAAKHLPALSDLSLQSNPLGKGGGRMLASKAGHFRALSLLDLAGSGIGSEGMSALARRSDCFHSLEYLNVQRCDIDDSVVDGLFAALRREPWRSRLTTLVLRGNPITRVPAELLHSEAAHQLREHAELLATDGWMALGEVKVVMLGVGGAGKTHVRRWMEEKYPSSFNAGEPRTHGIECGMWNEMAALEGTPHTIRMWTWDFGGQPELLAAHRLFLSDKRAAFLVVCDATKTRAENRLDYWLRLIRHEAWPGSPVIIAITKCDLLDDTGRHRVPRRLEPLDAVELKESAGMPFGTVLHVVDGIGWSGTSERTLVGPQRWQKHFAKIRSLRKVIAGAASCVPDIDSQYPPAFVRAVRWVETDGFKSGDGDQVGYVRRSSVLEACRQFGLDDGLSEGVLETANSLGLVHYPGARRQMRRGEALAETVFNPEWVRSPLYRLVREGHRFASHGMLTWEQIEAMLPEHDGEPQAATLWERLPFNAADRVCVVDWMISCGLIFDVPRGALGSQYFVPELLLPRLLTEAPAGNHVWKREFRWLPAPVFGRLLGHLVQQGAVESDALWRDEITLKAGKRTRVTVRLSISEGQSPGSSGRHQVGATVFAAMSGCTESEAVRLLDQVDGVLRDILGEQRVGPTMWKPIDSSRTTALTNRAGVVPEYARYAVLVFTAVKDAHDRGGCDVKSWPDLLSWAARIVRARGEVMPDPDLAVAVRKAQSNPKQFIRYCGKAGLSAWWSSRGKRKVSRSAVDWSAEDQTIPSRDSDD